MSNAKSCTHIKVSGVRCGSPALRGEEFCYFHPRVLRTVRVPHSRIHQAALLEDEESIQASLMEVVNGLLRGTIEPKRGELILRALNTAVRNIRRVHFGLHASDMVREVPAYAIPPVTQVDDHVDDEGTFHRGRRPTPDEVALSKAAILARYYAQEPTAVSQHKSQASTVPPAPANATARKPPASVKEVPPSARRNDKLHSG